jgi:hypothetical protein
MTQIPVNVTITPEAAAQASARMAKIYLDAVELAVASIQPVLDELDKLIVVHGKLPELVAIYDSLTELHAIYLKLTELLNLNSNLSTVTEVHNSLTELLAVEASLTELHAVYTDLSALTNLNSQISALTNLNLNIDALLHLEGNLADILTVNDALANIDVIIQNIEAVKNAGQAAIEAGEHNAMAQKWASEQEDVPVDIDNDLFSALHYASKARIEATQSSEDKAQTGLDRIAVNDDKLAVAADKLTVANDKATVAADKVTVAADKAITITAKNDSVAAKDLSVAAKDLSITAKTDSETAKTLSQKYAENPENTEVVTNEYSSKHWAKKAEKFVADANMSALWYGIQHDVTVSSPDTTRIGSTTLHASLPIQAGMKACLLNDDGTVNYYLNPTDWTKKLSGGTANLDGTDGQVMIEIPAFYFKSEVEGNLRRWKISEYALPGFTLIKKQFVSAFEASLNRTTSKLASVKNLTATYRGGGNTAVWDAQENTDLGRPATNLSRTNYRTYARARGAGWEMYNYRAHWMITVLFTIEYNTLNSQKAINAALDGSGFRQGGLGDGVTNLDGTKWSYFNGYFPFIACGQANSLGNASGAVAFTMPFGFDAVPTGATFKGAYASGTAYVPGDVVNYNSYYYTNTVGSTGVVPTNTANWSAAYLPYKGVYSAATAYIVNDFVSSGTALYKCILANTGQAVTNATYWTAVTRSTTNVNGYRGVEMPFGHIWKNADGINIRAAAASEADPTHKMYITDTPANWNDANYTNYTLKGELARVDGYIKQMIAGEVMPLEVGGGSSTYWCDYAYQSIPGSGVVLRTVLFGGDAYFGALAGLGCSSTISSPSSTYANFGSRLCFIPSA